MSNEELTKRMVLTEDEFHLLSEAEQLPFYKAVLPSGHTFYQKKPRSKSERKRLEWLEKVKVKYDIS